MLLHPDLLERERVVANKEAIESNVHIGQIEVITSKVGNVTAHIFHIKQAFSKKIFWPKDYVSYFFVVLCHSSVVSIVHIDPL